MRFQSLEKSKNEYPSWADLIGELDEYLYEVSNRERGFTDLSLPGVAKRLGVDRQQALALLGLADDAGIVHPKYVVYTPDYWELGSYSSEDEIPRTIYSEEEGKSYASDEVLVELLFEFEDIRKSAYA